MEQRSKCNLPDRNSCHWDGCPLVQNWDRCPLVQKESSSPHPPITRNLPNFLVAASVKWEWHWGRPRIVVLTQGDRDVALASLKNDP